MSKIKYTEEIKVKAVELRLAGKSIPEITNETGIKKDSLNKLFHERDVKMSPEHAAEARARRWLDHKPVIDGKKECSKCGESFPLEEFHVNNNRLSGRASACKKCYGLFYEENSESIKQRARKYGENNKEKKKESARKWYLKSNNRQKKIENASKWAKDNPERKREIEKKYDKANQPKKNARTAKYRAAKIQATPSWLTQHQIDEMRRMYENCPPGFEVDHIVPLRGKDVRGLHVPWNLQYLPESENNSKGNRLKDPRPSLD